MGDYIEVGKILEFLDAETNALNSTFGEIGGEAGAYVECLKDVRSEIERFPTADAVPVVYARWINKRGGFWETADCSNCGERHPTVGFAPNYCPNCGARMDLEETDNG